MILQLLQALKDVVTIGSGVVGGVRIPAFGIGIIGSQNQQIMKIGPIKNCLSYVISRLDLISSIEHSDSYV